MPRPVLLLKNPSTPEDPYDKHFRQNGFLPVFIPLLNHSHWDRDATIAYLNSSEFAEIPYFIITSKRGVEMFADCLADVPPQQQQMIYRKRAYTVGPATAEELERIGFTNIGGGANAGNGRKLADFIHEELGPGRHRIVFFTGEIRKDILPVTLKNYGFDLTERVIYKTEDRQDILDQFTAAWNTHKDNQPWVVFFSPQGTAPVVHTIGGLIVPIAVIGPTTEEYLIENKITPTVVAAHPTAASLVAAITST